MAKVEAEMTKLIAISVLYLNGRLGSHGRNRKAYPMNPSAVGLANRLW
jgi:hypothetical protein